MYSIASQQPAVPALLLMIVFGHNRIVTSDGLYASIGHCEIKYSEPSQTNIEHNDVQSIR